MVESARNYLNIRNRGMRRFARILGYDQEPGEHRETFRDRVYWELRAKGRARAAERILDGRMFDSPEELAAWYRKRDV